MTKYEPQLVAFLDVLGTKDATLEGNSAASPLLRLLIKLSELKSDFARRETTVTSTIKHLDIKPAISTFSDHIVISLPLNAIPELGDIGFSELVLQISKLTSWIAAHALELGYLIRGGLAVGELHHESSVVFGKALVDAYHVESELSVYPRVVLSPSLMEPTSWRGFADIKRDDDDGLYYLDYMSRIIFENCGITNEADKSRVREWYGNICRIVRERLDFHASSHKLKEFSKWAWFAKHFRDCLVRNSFLLADLGWDLEAFPKT